MPLYGESRLASITTGPFLFKKTEDKKRVDVSFLALQFFWGEMQLPLGPFQGIKAVRTVSENETTWLEWQIWSGMDRESATPLVKIPAHFFWRLLRSQIKDMRHHPIIFAFQLCQEGFQHLEKEIPGIYHGVQEYHESRGKPFPEIIFAVLDPVHFEWKNDGETHMNCWYESGISLFHKTFDDYWVEHQAAHMLRFPDPRFAHGPMEAVDAEDLVHLTRRFGLRNFDTGEGEVRNLTNRKFLPRKEGKKKKVHHMTARKMREMAEEEEAKKKELEEKKEDEEPMEECTAEKEPVEKMDESADSNKDQNEEKETVMPNEELGDGGAVEEKKDLDEEPKKQEEEPMEEDKGQEPAPSPQFKVPFGPAPKQKEEEESEDDDSDEEDSRDMSSDGLIVYPENLDDFFESIRLKKTRKNRLLKELEDRVVKEKVPRKKAKVEEEVEEKEELPPLEPMEFDLKDMVIKAEAELRKKVHFVSPQRFESCNADGSGPSTSGSAPSTSSYDEPSTSGPQPDSGRRPQRNRHEPKQVYEPTFNRRLIKRR